LADQNTNLKVKFLDRNPPDFSEQEAKQITLDLYGLEGEFTPLTSERDSNFRIRTETEDSYVLKLSNVGEEPGDIDFQTQALLHIQSQDPELLVPRVIRTKDGDAYSTAKGPQGADHLVHMLTYLPGKSMVGTSRVPAQWRNLGETLARLDLALRGFFHPHGRRVILWDLTRCVELRPHTEHIADPAARKNIEAILDHMASTVLPQLTTGRHQVIHADANPDNVLMDPSQPERITGIIDFGDMVFAPLITDLAIATILENVLSEEGLQNLSALVSGFDSVLPLEEQEIDLLYDLILARRAITAVIIAWRKTMTPDQPTYLLDREQPTWDAIAHMMSLGRAEVSDRLRSACRFPPYVPTDGVEEDEEEIKALAKQRRSVLGYHLSLFYTKPLHIERGRGPWLHDARGRRYLDAYNNVPVTGHCHPHVVRAIQRQTAALNTNTRYLYKGVVEYADRLTSLFPKDLNACVFVNSGSEANDIAWRMAQFTTGGRGALVLDHGYHGITQATADLTPSDWFGDPPLHVRTTTVPDPYRGPHREGEHELAERYAEDVHGRYRVHEQRHPRSACRVSGGGSQPDPQRWRPVHCR
jgi:Ser/Thr protein kinase RdoA (MazF antagonist)